jgi:hypothetical protein
VQVQPVSDYPRALARSLAACAPPAASGHRPTVAVLTPGIYNSAYFEHAFLADQMGAELVEGSDLRVVDGRVCHAHHAGLDGDRRAVSARGRQFPRSPHLQSFQRAGCSRHYGCLSRGRDHHRQCAGHGHCRRQGDLLLHARDRRVLHRREADPANVPTWRCAEADRWLTCWITCPNWW